jgi:hypothetical protein
MHAAGEGRTREQRVAQVRADDPSVGDFAAYVPVGDAIAKLRRWREQGAAIDYLSSHRDSPGVAADESVLRRFGFPRGRVLARRSGESYGDVVARELPDVLIEDDCESIGADQVAHSQLPPELRVRIRSIVAPEFGGIDHLPDSLVDLASLGH